MAIQKKNRTKSWFKKAVRHCPKLLSVRLDSLESHRRIIMTVVVVGVGGQQANQNTTKGPTAARPSDPTDILHRNPGISI
jgi:hypothetical protein